MVAIIAKQPQCPGINPEHIPEDLSAQDEKIFFQITNTQLDKSQTEKIRQPAQVYPNQKEILAVHWHPEFIPLELILQRVDKMFPARENELIIPTQHNQILSHQGFSGVEVDCYSTAFNQKVQLLLHFESSKLKSASILKSMLEYTRKYRSSQLFEFINTICNPIQERLDLAVRNTGADPETVRFTQIHVAKIKKLLDKYLDQIPQDMIKNKLLRNYFDSLRSTYGEMVIDRCQSFLNSVKKQVKSDFPLQYFYRVSEIIEEARLYQAGVVVPHPEQFWPILLAEYDVDGYEVWNPQSQRYTDFLIDVVNKKNMEKGLSQRKILIFMGDDTHMGEKIKEPKHQDKDKASREIGYQPAWDDLDISKKLIKAGVNRSVIIEEYKQRLSG